MLVCPYCQGLAAPLPVLSSLSRIDFFLCEICAKVLERPKGHDGQPAPVNRLDRATSRTGRGKLPADIGGD